MKKLTIITFLFFVGIINAHTLLAQDADIFSYMEEHLSDDEIQQIDRAKTNISKGDKLETKIKAEDKKVDKYFKKKKKKGEKKSAEVKEMRIKQALYYEKAYAAIYNVYYDKVNAANFIYDEDRVKADGHIDDAITENAEAKKVMKQYKSVSPKDLKKKIEYAKLKSDLQSAKNSYIGSIQYLIEAYTLVVDQEAKKQLEDQEEQAWQNAESDGTIYGYQSYLNDFPSGKYASAARSRIEELEDEERRKREEEKSRNMKGALVYQVQIAASKKALPKWKVARLYKATSEVTRKNYDGWYKYSVGKFTKYEDAKKFVKAVRIKGAFVVAYLNDEKIDIKEAIRIQQ